MQTIGLKLFIFLHVVLISLYADYPKEKFCHGGIVKLYFDEKPTIYINNKKQKIFLQELDKKYKVLLPIYLYSKKDIFEFFSKTASKKQNHQIRLQDCNYKKQYIKVKNKEFVKPKKKKTVKRVSKDFLIKQKNLAKHTKLHVESLQMIKPLNSKLRHDFGRKRFYNNIPRSPHAGIDLSGKKGTKIKAALDGEVILLGNLFYNGNMVLIDHGQGLITAYSHLSKIYKATGYKIKKGEFIGEVGMSGRATGPHLHFSVYLNGQPVNPDLFLEDANF